MEILMLPSERSSSDLKVRRLSDIYLLLDLTNYVLCKCFKIYNAICSLVLRRGFLIPCAILVLFIGHYAREY